MNGARSGSRRSLHNYYVFLGTCLQEEHDEIRARKGEFEALEWEDYKSMPFTLCVSGQPLLPRYTREKIKFIL